MRPFTALATILLASGTLGSEDAAPTRTVSTSYATYSGSFTPPYSLGFLGVPYAEPPVGDLRFRKPLPLNTRKFNKTAIIDASSYPDFCVQASVGLGDAGGAGSEDCLKVNIYKPFNATSSSKLPVLVYIHGGGYTSGNPRNWPFEHWINQSPNIVAVSVYYRLSSFGFLSHPSFSDSSNGDHNAGFHDQVQALRWVKQHIAAFGGDPDRVTINGESAGGGSVQMHLVAPESRDLFHGAIAQSVGRLAMPTPDQQVDLFNAFSNQTGCGSGNLSKVFKCLRGVPVSALARAQDAKTNITGYNSWRPVLDGRTFSDYPTNLLQQGKFARVPIIAGSTSNESIGAIPGQSLGTILTAFYPQMRPKDVNEFQRIYSKSSFPSQDALVDAAVGEVLLRCGREILGNAGVRNTRAWTYRYNQPNPTSPFDAPGLTGHAAENWMMFLGVNTGTNGSAIFTGLNPVQTAFSQELIAYWISFVRSSDPNVHKLQRSPVWTGFEKNVRVVLQQDTANSTTKSSVVLEKEPADEAERCLFIASKSDVTQI